MGISLFQHVPLKTLIGEPGAVFYGIKCGNTRFMTVKVEQSAIAAAPPPPPTPAHSSDELNIDDDPARTDYAEEDREAEMEAWLRWGEELD